MTVEVVHGRMRGVDLLSFTEGAWLERLGAGSVASGSNDPSLLRSAVPTNASIILCTPPNHFQHTNETIRRHCHGLAIVMQNFTNESLYDEVSDR